MANKQEQRIELGITKQDMGRDQRAVLILDTDKGYRPGVRSGARVMWVGGGFESCELFGDFSKSLKTTASRATQGAIDKQHAAVFTTDVVAALVEEAKAFYAKEDAERAAFQADVAAI